MAIPKSLKPISKEKALAIIAKHEKAGDGYWEDSPMYSDFIYEGAMTKYGYRQPMLIRPCPSYTWETGKVSM